VVAYYAIAALLLIGYLCSSRSPLKLRVVPIRGRLFRDILRVGLLSAIGTVQGNLTVGFVTAAVGRFGADAIAGYGIASRLDYLQIPLLFAFGTAVVTMVGINVGADQPDRARRIAWIGAAVAFGFTELLGVLAACFPRAWLGLFSHDLHVLTLGSQYLGTVGPTYGAIGIGMILYFASQGAKRVLFPVLAGTARMTVATFIGWLAVANFGASLPALFQIIAVSTVLYGGLVSATMMERGWGRQTISLSPAENNHASVRPPGSVASKKPARQITRPIPK
jgi:MATE family, multidrug efflux pump